MHQMSDYENVLVKSSKKIKSFFKNTSANNRDSTKIYREMISTGIFGDKQERISKKERINRK